MLKLRTACDPGPSAFYFLSISFSKSILLIVEDVNSNNQSDTNVYVIFVPTYVGTHAYIKKTMAAFLSDFASLQGLCEADISGYPLFIEDVTTRG